MKDDIIFYRNLKYSIIIKYIFLRNYGKGRGGGGVQHKKQPHSTAKILPMIMYVYSKYSQ